MSATVSLPLSAMQAALARIKPAIPPANCNIPALRTVRIENTEHGTTFVATDLNIAARATLRREQEPGAPFLLSSERFLGYTDLLDGDEIVIKPGESGRASLKCGRAKTSLPTLPVANYPQTIFSPEGDATLLPQDVFRRLLHFGTVAVSYSEALGAALTGALLSIDRTSASLVTTDGHRMAVYTVPFEGPQPGVDFLLPPSLLEALAGKVLSDTAEHKVLIQDADPNICVTIEGVMPLDLTARKIAGSRFPNYKAVLPSAAAVTLSVNTAEFLSSITRCASIADPHIMALKLKFSPDAITVEAKDAQAGETEEAVAAYAGEAFTPFVTGFKAAYLTEALKRIKATEVTISFAKADATSAIKISTIPAEDEEFVYIVMPLKVS